MLLKKFHCDGAWLKSPFFRQVVRLGSFALSLVLHAFHLLLPFKTIYVCPDSAFAISHICGYRLCSLLFLYSLLPSKQSVRIQAGSLDPMGQVNTSKGECTPHVGDMVAHTLLLRAQFTEREKDYLLRACQSPNCSISPRTSRSGNRRAHNTGRSISSHPRGAKFLRYG